MKIRWPWGKKPKKKQAVPDKSKGDSSALFALTDGQSDSAWDRMDKNLDEKYVWPKYGKPGFWRGGGL